MQQGKRHAVGSGLIGFFVLPGTQAEGHQCIDADAKADGNGVEQVLHREDQREGRHGGFVDAGHKQAVHNVVQRVDQHGNDIGQRHRHQKREDRALFHKGVVHRRDLLSSGGGCRGLDAKKPHNGFCTIVWRKIA